MGWCKYGFINQMVKLASHRFQGIAGRSNIERPTSNVEWEKIKNTEEREWGDGRWGAPGRRRLEGLLKKLIILF